MIVALEDVAALYSGPSFLMADPMGPLLDQDEDEALSPFSSLEGRASASPPLSLSSYDSSLSPFQTLSPSPSFCASPPNSSILGTKAVTDSLSHPWVVTSGLLDAQVGADDGKGDAFMDMEWMSEKLDLSEFDLDSFIGSSVESPSSPEDLLASLDSSMKVDLESFDTAIPTLPEDLDMGLEVPTTHTLSQEIEASEAKQTEETSHEEVVLKSEPPSPAPSPFPPSPVCTLEVESEVDVLEAEKMATSVMATIIPDPSGNIHTTSPIVLSLPASGHIVVVLTNKNEPPLVSLPDQSIKSSPPSSDCESDSGIESISSSPTHFPSSPSSPASTAGSSRTKPYSKPESTTLSSPTAKAPRVKSVSGAPKVVEKKLKKMEQNKTAATRYRQKKRVEQEHLSTELQGLEQRNRELAEKAESISREIQYLKDLMEEVRKHRRGKTSSVAQ
eukprot:XP_003976856.1 PREDICTED: cyclic AMP-dependent transcription factor ATF-4-like isoform X2 [Takifugu rubripes]